MDTSETVFEATNRGAGAGIAVLLFLRGAALEVPAYRPAIPHSGNPAPW